MGVGRWEGAGRLVGGMGLNESGSWWEGGEWEGGG